MTYIAIAKSGDLVGMANKGEIVSIDVGSAGELRAWRKFNKVNKIYLAAASFNVESNFSDVASALFWAASEVFCETSAKMREIYGEEVWNKWAARTTWVVKKKGVAA